MGKPMGLIDGDASQVLRQVAAVAIAWVLAIFGTFLILKICDALLGVRISEKQEIEGLDLSIHGEEAYNFEL
jgi:Amt family ammonium transporter